jgi:hypothetical protein
MTNLLTAPCWTKANADAVLQTQALAAQDAIFLATHSPVRDFEAWSEKFDVSEPTQESLLQALSAPDRRHAFCVVQGEPGSGKSHLIRWLQVNWPVQRDFCLLIQRADGSLVGALKQLKSKLPTELGYLFDGLGHQHAAGLGGRSALFLTTLGTMLAPDYFDAPPEDIDWCRQFEPDKLILSAAIRDNWNGPRRVLEIMSGGADRNSASATFDIADVRELATLWETMDAGDSERAKHLGLKLSLESTFIEEALADGRTIDEIRSEDADQIANTLQMADALNARRNHAVQGVIGVSADALKRIFMELRAELARQDQDKPIAERRRLVLLLEDVTMWEGLDDSLIDALVADAELRDDDDLCPLISVIGLTTEYFRQLKSNYQQRITHSVRLGLSAEGEVREIAALDAASRQKFVARYLSAVRAGVEDLQAWREDYRLDADLQPPNPCLQCARVEPCFQAFGSVGNVGLYPFTPEAVDGFYDNLKANDLGQTHRTPRGMLQGVLNPTLLNPSRLETAAYPGPEIESRYLERPFLDTAMRTVLRHRVEDEGTRNRLSRVLSYWGDRRPTVTQSDNGERFAGVPRSVLEAFALPWVGEGQAVSQLDITQAPRPREATEAVRVGPTTALPPATPMTPRTTRPTPRTPSEPRSASKKELQRLLEQINALRGEGVVPNATVWNRAVYDVLILLDPRRIGVDRRTFEQVFTAENVKIAGTGQVRDTHFVVSRTEWLIEGLEAYARLKTDDDLTGEQVEFHRRRLSALNRRLEQLAARHARRLMPKRTDGEIWSPAYAAAQVLLARAWLRGGASPIESSAAQWKALLSDEAEPTTGPSARTQPWQDALTAGDKRHDEIRLALRQMISLPQGNAAGFGLADASAAAFALADLRRTLAFAPGLSPNDREPPFGWQGIRLVADKMSHCLPRISKGEQDMLQDRAARLLALLRGKAPQDHDTRLQQIIDAVSSDLIGRANTEVQAWHVERRRQSRVLDADAHERLIELLWRLSPEYGQTPLTGAEGLAWLIAAPAADLANTLELFKCGETAVAALLPHVRDLIEEADKGVNIDDIHEAGRALADAAEAARRQLTEGVQ